MDCGESSKLMFRVTDDDGVYLGFNARAEAVYVDLLIKCLLG